MLRPLRVLVVDDNPQDRRLVIRELLKVYPEAVISEAIDQSQLDEQIQRANFDIVITDYHLQWSDGIRVLRAVKQTMPDCPVIMFTATGSEEVAVEAMKNGLDDYIIKNVKHLVRLRGAVQAALEHAQTKKHVRRLESRLESVLSQLHVGVFSCTPAGNFLDLNDAMVTLLEHEFSSDAHQMTLKSLFADEAEAERFLQQVVGSQEPWETEIETTANAAMPKVYRLNVRFIPGDGGEPRIDGLLEDISRRKQYETDAKQAAVAAAKIAMLSPREKEVLREVVAGSANKLIARKLDISEKTVEKHRSNLTKKLEVRSVAELVRLAVSAESAVK